ncbi:sigma-70 family RNA polymerase sigma factor [Actinosynnema sp. NPDC023794]
MAATRHPNAEFWHLQAPGTRGAPPTLPGSSAARPAEGRDHSTTAAANGAQALRAAPTAQSPGSITQDEVDHRVADSVDADVRARRMAEAIAGLRAEERDVLLLVAWGELTTAEIAEVLGIKEQTVRTRLHRARTKLRTEEARDA